MYGTMAQTKKIQVYMLYIDYKKITKWEVKSYPICD